VRTVRFLVFCFLPAVAAGAEIDRLFDMGPAASPVARGATAVDEGTVYSARRGYGWERAPRHGFNDESGLSAKADAQYPLHLVQPGKALYRDGFEDERAIRFRCDVAPGEYLVTVFVGRYRAPRHDINVRINGAAAARNVDAWGQVWGSQGGTPVKSVKRTVEAKEGTIRIEVDYAPSRPDSWKEYTSKEPEGGRLWYLGRNMSSILGVRIRTAPSWGLAVEGGKFTGAGFPEPLERVLETLNREGPRAAADLLGRVKESDPLKRALVIDAVASHLDTPSALRVKLLSDSLRLLRSLEERTIPMRERIEVEERVLVALKFMRMWSFSWAQEKTGLNGYQRYWAAYECCNCVPEGDPLYPLSLLIRTRVAYWNGREGGWKHCYDLARRHARRLAGLFPGHPLVRMYLGERIREPYPPPEAAPGAPRWAILQREALGLLRGVVSYWVEERQAPNGELGGGWGDDVEILRSWTPLVLAVGDETALRGARRLADGVLVSGVVENGYSKDVGDVEHAAEPVSDTQPLMVASAFGDPAYVETCMETMRCMRNVWTGIDKNGELHFKSHWFSATKTVDTPPRSADVPLNARAVKPGLWVLWYNGHRVVRELITQWAGAWAASARRTDRGKPRGIVPGSISFPEGRIGGYADAWWKARGYDDLTAMGYTASLYHVLVGAWAESGKVVFLEPVLRALQAVRAFRSSKEKNLEPGSLLWVGRVHDGGAFFDVVEKLRLLSGDDSFDDLLLPRATGMTCFRLTGKLDRLERELTSIVDRLTGNRPMITTEVLFTDRVSIPGSTVLTSMLTGSAGNPTYYPVHAVTWRGVGDKAAALVERATATRLEVLLYAFTEDPYTLSARLWRLMCGTYELVVRPVGWKEGEVALSWFKVKEKGTRVEFTIPPRRLVRLIIKRRKKGRPAGSLPDLAIARRDIKRLPEGALLVTVHNIGTRSSSPFSVAAEASNGKTWSASCPEIPAPIDLLPKTRAVKIEFPQELKLKAVVVDPEGKIDELYECNNRVEMES